MVHLQNSELNKIGVSPKQLKQNVIYIESGHKILGNYDVVKFMKQPRVQDFIRNKSLFH